MKRNNVNLLYYQGRRNGGGAGPLKFSKVPFFREQSALFLREKCHSDCIFCAKGTFENLNLCYFREIFFISGKNIKYSEKILLCPENFFHF